MSAAASLSYPPKDEDTSKKCLNKLADAVKRLVTRAAEAWLAIVGKDGGVILSFLGKVFGFVAEHAQASADLRGGIIGVWLM